MDNNGKYAMGMVHDTLTTRSLVSNETDQIDQTQFTRAAAAWGEEVRSSSIVSSNYFQVLVVSHGYSLRLAFDNLTCVVRVNTSSKATDVVRGVTGYAESGMMTAVVGGGRAGKSAFLGTLAGEQDPSKGTVYFNGNDVNHLVRRRATGYCWFGDEHAAWHGTTTVREALCLSAYLRQGNDILESRKMETVEAWLELLGLTALADEYVESCSAVETRLVAIGVELAFAPIVLLLDEPTNDLDEKDSQRIVQVLQQVARTGRTVVCSLSDSTPSIELCAFSRLLLLSSGGETIFHGESRQLVQYLEAAPGVRKFIGGKSITAWALESVTFTSRGTVTTTKRSKSRMNTKKKKHASADPMSSSDVDHEKEARFVQLFQNSEMRTLLNQMRRVGYLRPDSKNIPTLIKAYNGGKLTPYASSWHTQVTWLVRRVVFSYWRSMTINSMAMRWKLVGVLNMLLVLFVWFLWIFVARNTEHDTFDRVILSSNF